MPSVTLTPDGTITLESILQSAKTAGFKFCGVVDSSVHVNSFDKKMLDNWLIQYTNNPHISVAEPKNIHKFFSRARPSSSSVDIHGPISAHASGRYWFTASELAAIYNFPSPGPAKVVVGVISFGGGLYGSVDKDGVLTNGDCQTYWASIGIPAANMPKVIVRGIDGATNIPDANDGGSTYENTLDVETIGGVCPSANLTIILYIGPNTLSEFPKIINYALNTPVVISGLTYKPTILSISWGAPERYFNQSDITKINNYLATANSKGINICAATGDNGSNDGVGGISVNADFPAASPYVTAVGGTSLVCANRVYDSNTRETAWSDGGGAVSVLNPKPAYQSAIVAGGRSTPDIALNADPNTGVVYTVNKTNLIFGGTSISAPTFAGFLACVNASKFINPLLYAAKPNCFHDVTSGSNGAYRSKAGYDNCTGLGSINGFYTAGAAGGVLATNIGVPPTLALAVSQTTTPVITWTPANVSSQLVSWSSNNTNVASVSTTGVVSAIGVGTAILTVSALDGSNKKASIIVSVVKGNSVVRVDIQTPKQIHCTEHLQLVPLFSPSDATNKNVSWSVNNHNVAVSASGLVSGLHVGSSIITCTSADGNIKGTTTIDVIESVASVKINISSCAMNVGQKTLLMATCLPGNAPNKTVSWASSNPSVVSVDNNGNISALANGTASISATSNDSGVIANVAVVVSTRVQSVNVVPTLTLYKNQVTEVSATIVPTTATDKTYSWSSSNTNIVSVTPTGGAVGVAYGQAQLIATAKDGRITGSIHVTVCPRTTFT